MFRNSKFGPLLAMSVLMAAAEAQTSTGGAAADPAAGAGDGSAAEARKRAPASNFLPIVRGRLPLIFVHAIRFNKVLNAMGNKDLATKFGTSVGKVFDIKKGRNFGYVTESYKPTAEDVAAAEAHIKQIGEQNAKGLSAAGDKTLLQTTLDEYKGRGLATAEEAAAQSTARTATRASTAAPAADGATKPAGKTSGAKVDKATGVQANAGNAADALLK